MAAALRAYIECLLELLSNVDVPAAVALLPGVGRNFQPFTLRGPWLSLLLEPCHHGNREVGKEVEGDFEGCKAPAISTGLNPGARP
jgi:hypothetical protein